MSIDAQVTTEVNATVVRITPHRAIELLRANERNVRKLKRAKLNQFADDMRAGKWRMNGEPIKIQRDDGFLQDGQHRLMACAITSIPFDTMLVTGLPPEAVETMDQGTPRSMTDILKWRGEVDASNLSAAINLSWRWEQGSLLAGGIHPSRAQMLAWLEKNPGIRNCVRYGRALREGIRIPHSVGAAFSYRALTVAPDHAEDFISKVASGIGLGEREAPFALRRTMIDRLGKPGVNTQQETLLAYMIKTWNFWLQGIHVSFVRWHRVGTNAEDFPVMLTPDEVC